MKNKILKTLGTGALGILIVAAFIVAMYALSWIATCGLIYLVTLCFGWKFNWFIATGVWLVMLLARSVFKSNTTVNNNNSKKF